jgi:hypothetical protein
MATIEIATLLGDSVVDVTYRSEPTRPPRARSIFATVGLVCVLGAGVAFGASVSTAAANDAALATWTATRPAYAFRSVRDSRLLELGAFGGMALGVCAFTAMLLCRRRDVDSIVLAGERVTFAELAALEGTIDRGPATYVIRRVEAPRRESLQPAPSQRLFVYAAGSLAVHLGLLWLMSHGPIEGDANTVWVSVHQPVHITTTVLPPDESDHGDRDYEERPSLVIDEMPDIHWHPAQHSLLAKPAVSSAKARELAIEAARKAGILGSGLLQPDFLSSLHSDIYHHAFVRDDVCAAFGVCTGSNERSFGFRRSLGCIGVIPQMATITSELGTIGGGRGAGASYELRERVAHEPTARLGRPVTAGAYDKSIIRRYIKRHLTKINYCYEKELLSKPTLQGGMSVQFMIAPDGSVTTSVGHGLDENVATCVGAVVGTIRFPRPPEGAAVQVSYPFSFRPSGAQ